jgi:hypothetical protein
MSSISVLLWGACAGAADPPPPAERVPSLPDAEWCAGVPLVTLAELAAGEHALEVVAVDGVPGMQGVCTLLDGECINQCSAVYTLTHPPAFDLQLADLPVCHGMECAMDCQPFGHTPTRAYRFVGLVEPKSRTGPNNVALHVHRMCALEPT